MCIGAPKAKAKFLNISYWNIHGSNSKAIGNKLADPNFLKIISRNHIVGLAELHTNDKISLPGYKLVKQKIRTKKHKGPKIAGGLALFVKHEIDYLVQLIPNDNEDSIWIKIKKEVSANQKIFILVVFT